MLGANLSSHLGVVSREDLKCDRRDIFSDKVQPLLFISDLLHVDVISGDALISSSNALVLSKYKDA